MPRDASTLHPPVDPTRTLALIMGGLLISVGALGLLRCGVARFPDGPSADVWGLHFTPLLALLVLGVGVLLCVGSADRSRTVTTFTATFSVLGGLAIVIAHDHLPTQIATSGRLGWMLVVTTGVVLIADVTVPTLAGPDSDERSHPVRTSGGVSGR